MPKQVIHDIMVQGGDLKLTWACFEESSAFMFAMLVSGNIKEYEWPVKVAELSEEEFVNAFCEHVVSKSLVADLTKEVTVILS